MTFSLIDRSSWPREELFQHYFSAVPCSYSMSVKLDITVLIAKRDKLYPAMLHALSTIVNKHPEFRTAFDEKGQLGIYSELFPCYTIFHKKTETFSNLWTEYHREYESFLNAYESDLALFGQCNSFEAKPGTPANTFPVSMVPWVSFESFHLHLQKGHEYLLPIFTMGKYQEENGRCLLPLAIQVHHSVCDGFHVCRFINELQQFINQ